MIEGILRRGVSRIFRNRRQLPTGETNRPVAASPGLAVIQARLSGTTSSYDNVLGTLTLGVYILNHQRQRLVAGAASTVRYRLILAAGCSGGQKPLLSWKLAALTDRKRELTDQPRKA